MKRLIKSYFTFNKSERNGVFILSVILILLLFSNFSLPYFFPSQKIDFSSFRNEIDAFTAAQVAYQDSIERIKNNYIKANYDKPEPLPVKLFNFNPNNLPEKKWQQLGLKEYQIKTINNFQNKGGKFYKKKDLKKIYGISAALYKTLEPFIIIPTADNKDTYKEEENQNKAEIETAPPLLELNTAISYSLMELKGIGAFYSGNILKYREQLGGFINKAQLLEVYGMDSVLYESLYNKIIIDESKVKKLNINNCSIYNLTKHPYIKNHIAVSIVNYREHHGQYKDISEIKKSDLVNEELYLKLAPYLTVE